ncbi:MAG TPA: hypothetical protein VGL03_11480 [Thermoanaerobaculia bacterium]
MPEGPEVETERLREEIHEELEHEGSAFLKRIALTTLSWPRLPPSRRCARGRRSIKRSF